jgi:hypothetical protein
MKGSVLKTMKHLGFLPKDVPAGTSKLAYYTRAGFEKVMGTLSVPLAPCRSTSKLANNPPQAIIERHNL